MDYSVKEVILKQTWSQRQIFYNANPIFSDHDYSPELQKKRALLRGVIKQLKQKNVKPKCTYPAQLWISTEAGDKTYSTFTDAGQVLQELRVQVRVEERERMEWELSHNKWSAAGGRRGSGLAVLSATDVMAFLSRDE